MRGVCDRACAEGGGLQRQDLGWCLVAFVGTCARDRSGVCAGEGFDRRGAARWFELRRWWNSCAREMKVSVVPLATLWQISVACASSAEDGIYGNTSDVAEHGGTIITHIYEIVPIWFALMLSVLVACELKEKRPVDEGAPWSAIGVAR